jgi:hypothetical protein
VYVGVELGVGSAAEARDDARRRSEALRALLGRILEEVEDLRPELRATIEEALRS